MSTLYSDINELFLVGVQDYKLDRLYASATPTSLDEYLIPFMVRGLVKFAKCEQDLSNRDDTTRTFNIDLTDEEKVIIADLMIIEWLTREVNDIKQMNLHIRNKREFDHYAESQNLKEKSVHRIVLREEVDKLIVAYGYNNIDWETLG
jgi:hypothetical protein